MTHVFKYLIILPNEYLWISGECVVFSACLRIKRKLSTTEETPPAVHPIPYASFPPHALPQGGGTFIHTHSSLAPNKEESKWEGMENEKNVNAYEQINKESSKTEIFELYQEPVQEEDEWYAGEESPTTETQYCIAESYSVEEVREVLHDDNEEVWSPQQQQDELMEMMEQMAEERDACREELEQLRDHCTALENERSQLLSKVGTIILLHFQLSST